MIPWRFNLDISKLEAKEEFELSEMFNIIKKLENTRKSIIPASLHFKGIGAFDSQINERRSKLMLKDHSQPKLLSEGWTSNQNVIGMRPVRSGLDSTKAKQVSTHTRKKYQAVNKMTKVPSLPSIIQAYRADSMNVVMDMKKKLSKAAFKSALKLSIALDELNF
jgi:hypothetical protein